mmetsp:Transcript_42466/g.51507  ORF Transcript_42466/g.51507 Transcript_42466/m.51507 type:complete len:515 (-) Transcript_42466:445-1989(-)|eukprot:CAMPEP_0197852956 /NCGR_PEP_ID=MMETSP1438-20131217/21820_1 /TAXON_ID=1461541 /ORGANISM="Pterosperma sp., Strain CCMP1384" /LENGTH=514 /DNA_ID=CAMNT_0043467201 /DNA_START=402 /DNA_END=1946 /DNA_ORIENTATION=+
MANLTAGQLGSCMGFFLIILLWGYSELLSFLGQKAKEDEQDPEGQSLAGKAVPKKELKPVNHTTLLRCLSLDKVALGEAKYLLRDMFEFGTILAWFYIADRTDWLQESEKSYSRDFFMFFMICLTLTFAWKHISVMKDYAPPLHREQTEEWKGWMQVMFLLYHYFNAGEMYNAIRLFIAAYVWMTGFGNFSYYYIRKDFTIGRFAHMMWRLNFFVLFACITLNNSYVLYYICPMHTIFTLFIYAALGIMSHHNETNTGVAVKFSLCILLVVFIWEVPGVFKTIFTPLKFLIGYVDPRKPDSDPLHEWFFRSGLDRYVWIYGMLCAYLHPTYERCLKALDEMSNATHRNVIRGIIFAVCLVAGTAYYQHIFILPKFEYNAVHPFTSWIPITLFILVRNLFPNLRAMSLSWYAWLGKITLETYISQFHIWLSTSGIPDGQPKKLLCILPGYPLVNFIVCTAMYIWISYRLFSLTNSMKTILLPLKDNPALLNNLGVLAGGMCALYVFGLVSHFVIE